MNILPQINPKQETKKIVEFLKKIKKKTKKDKVVIGLSGGIDSTVAHYLLKKAYKPENIISVSLPYEKIKPIINEVAGVEKKGFPTARRSVDIRRLSSTGGNEFETGPATLKKIRYGNIMARVRMIILFDLAKKYDALVCGTENKSERLLGYFTRFGDAASDIEPITYLYKTQVYQLAKYLKVSQKIIDAPPTAGLWQGQTDEAEFGFSYIEADQFLYLYIDKKIPLKKIKLKNAEKIIKRVLNNQFKQEVPYSLLRETKSAKL